jgi:Na+-driven multidrug efflux pump
MSGSKTFDRTIVEGSLGHAVWRLAWPTMVQNIIGGLQGIIDQAMVGHYVGYGTSRQLRCLPNPARYELLVETSHHRGKRAEPATTGT